MDKKMEMVYNHLIETDDIFYTKVLANDIMEKFDGCKACTNGINIRVDDESKGININLYCRSNSGIDGDYFKDLISIKVSSSKSTILEDLEKFME